MDELTKALDVIETIGNDNEKLSYNFTDIVELLLKCTEQGQIIEWPDRMASVAREINLPLCNIEWSGTPRNIATNIVDYSYKYYSSHDPIIKYLKNELSKL